MHTIPRRTWPILAVVFLFSLVAAASGAETGRPQVMSFTDSSLQWKVHAAKKRGGSYHAVGSPAGQKGRVGRLGWKADHAKYLVLHTGPKRTIKPFTDRLDGTIQVRLYSPGTDANKVNLRLQDSRGAVYQWDKKVNLRRSGWHELTYRIKPENFSGSWSLPEDGGKTPVLPVKLQGFAVSLRPEKGHSGHVDFDHIRFYGTSPEVRVPSSLEKDEMLPLLRALNISLASPSDRLPVAKPSDVPPVKLRLQNPALESVEFRIKAELSNFKGQTYTAERSVQLDPGAAQTWRLPRRPNRESIWWIDYALTTPDGGSKKTGRFSMAVFEPTGPDTGKHEGFLFGLCNHSERRPPEEQRIEARAAGLVGADVVRSSVTWGGIQPGPNRWNWEKQDRLVRLYGENGIELQCLLAFTPRWAATVDPSKKSWEVWSRKPPETEAWARFCRRMAKRYSGKIRFWEVWNEPDLDFFRGSADDYLEMLRVAYREIKSADKDHRVMTGGFANTSRNPDLIKKVLREGKDYYDILAWHQHGNFSSFEAACSGKLAAWRKKYAPDKPLIFNETAVSTWTLSGERQHAAHLVKKLTFAWSFGARGYWWYLLRDSAPPSADNRGATGWGLLKYDLQPRAAYVAYNAMVETLKGLEFDRRFDLGSGRWLLGFRGDDRYVLVGWTQPPTDPGKVELQTSARGARRLNLMGNGSPVPLVNGEATIALERQPAYIVLKGTSDRPSLAEN